MKTVNKRSIGVILLDFLVVAALFGSLAQSMRSMTLEQYQKDENSSNYVVFHQYSNAPSEIRKENYPSLEKLIYTTPWNVEGYDLSIKYAHKLDYVVPCWYEIVFKKEHILVDSDANYNQTYINALRKANPDIKILPRVSITGSKKTIFQAIGSVEGKFKKAVSLIATLINKQKVDGLVFDTPYNLFLRDSVFDDQNSRTQNVAVKNLLVQLVNSIRINLYKKKLIFYSIPNPSEYINELSSERFVMLHVDGFMVQAFDSVEYDKQLKNALMWARLTSKIKSNAKYFVLLPFFSRRQRQGIKTIEAYKALQNNDFIYGGMENGICTFVEMRTHVQSYVPCFKYFNWAFNKISEESGVHVGFWEAGDGVQNYFLFL